MDLRITKYSHYFEVFAPTAKGRQFRRQFTEHFIEKSLVKKHGRFRMEPTKVYARRDLETECVSFHINALERFLKEAEKYQWNGCEVEIIDVPMFEPVKVEFEMEFTPWENQVPIIDFGSEPGIQKVITAQAGFGKTACSLAMAKNNGTRFAVVTLGGYEDRWIPEFYEKLNLKPEEVRSCCGCTKLYRLLREVKDKGIDKVKAIFISTATLRDFYKNWSNGKVVGSGCEDIHPRDLWEILGIGLVITDEAHKETHLHFISDLYSHVPKKIYLTATLFAKMDFQLFIYETFLPKRCRKEGGKINVYVDLVKVQYNLKDWQKAKVVGGQGSYSHTTYEAWIMADKERERRWHEALYSYTESNWLGTRKPEHKLLIFSATIEMCTRLTETFRKRQPGLVINSFTSGDDYQILLDSDIIFSTIGKSGTAVDIPNLTQAYLTVAIDSPNANIQALGRLRELKGEKKVPQSYHCFVCMNIDKHLDYMRSKETLFRGRVLSTRTAHLDQII